MVYFTIFFVIIALSEGSSDKFAKRRELLQRTCSKYKDPRRYEYRALFSDHVKNSTFGAWSNEYYFCIPSGTGLESWMKMMMNRTDIKNTLVLKKGLINVKHPMTRLLDGYLEFFVKSGSHSIVSSKLLAWLHHRKNTISSAQRSFDVLGRNTISFREFVTFLTECSMEMSECGTYMMNDAVGFYWVPYWQYCDVCRNNYDAVVHAETVEEDLNEIFSDSLHFPRSLPPSEEEVKTYFSQLTKTDILKLYHKYKTDFELFGYTPEKYLRLAQDSSCSS